MGLLNLLLKSKINVKMQKGHLYDKNLSDRLIILSCKK